MVDGSDVRTIRVELGDRGYDIRIGPGRIDRVGETLAGLGPPTRVFVVTDERVGALYAARVERSLADAGIPNETLTVPAGEKSKSVEELQRLWGWMLDGRIDRNSAVVALGGGVVGDLAGFAAATVLRGVACVQVPTTLLAQVDSSVGGKTGIDMPQGKNLVGAFWQPAAVEIDPATLKTLPERELVAGMAEVVKTGVIRSRELFELVESEAEAMLRAGPAPLGEAVAACCEIKARVVGADERDETGERAVLNFGHTVGHAVEAAAGYEALLHGEAVSIGMVAAGRVALRLGLWDEGSASRLERLLARLGLPVDLGAGGLGGGISDEAVMRHLAADKKAVAGKLHFVLPDEIGRACLRREPVAPELVEEVLGTLRGPDKD